MPEVSAEHMVWLVESRSKNQQLSLRLFQTMQNFSETIDGEHDLINTAQAPAGVCFSLWRAVFLSDVEDDNRSAANDVRAFMENLIFHNAVAYTQDRNARNWTFIFYINTARHRLEKISKNHPEILPSTFVTESDEDYLMARDLWTFFHTAAEVAVRNFEEVVRKLASTLTPPSP